MSADVSLENYGSVRISDMRAQGANRIDVNEICLELIHVSPICEITVCTRLRKVSVDSEFFVWFGTVWVIFSYP